MPNKDAGNRYSIKAVSLATGLGVETLRAWERRYSIVEPKRDVGGRRIYAACDVARLRRLREAIDRGHSIGKIAGLADAELCRLLADPGADRTEAAAARNLAARVLCALERYAPDECDQAIAMAFALLPLTAVVGDVLAPTLREVGDRWHRGEFNVGQERLVSGAVRRQLGSMLNAYNATATSPTVVFATTSGELHELGVLMYAAISASHKLRVCYLGADMPPEEIGCIAERIGAAAVAISMVMPDNLELSLRQLAKLRASMPRDIEIWIGGAASFHADPSQFPAGSIHMAGHGDFVGRLALLTAAAR